LIELVAPLGRRTPPTLVQSAKDSYDAEYLVTRLLAHPLSMQFE